MTASAGAAWGLLIIVAFAGSVRKQYPILCGSVVTLIILMACTPIFV